jgi:hypothetical protein
MKKLDYNAINKIIMKITICGSVAFNEEAIFVKKELEKLGHDVEMWPLETEDKDGKVISVEDYYKIRKKAENDEGWVWDMKAKEISRHFDKIVWADAILVLNYDKKEIKGYVGGNTLMEMGLAFFLKKKIYLLNNVPDLSYKEEILGVMPIIINGNLSKIR